MGIAAIDADVPKALSPEGVIEAASFADTFISGNASLFGDHGKENCEILISRFQKGDLYFDNNIFI